MFQLVYISTMREAIDGEELEAILAASRRNNAANDVTGLLLVGGNRFLQALEGPTRAVLATYDRIKTDSRHFAFVTLSSQQVARRVFGDWSMAAQRGSSSGQGGLVDIVDELTNDLSDLNLQAELRGFARVHAAA